MLGARKVSRQERTASRVRRGTAQAEQAIDQAVRRVRCKECNGMGTRVDGVTSVEHEATCSKAAVPRRAKACDRCGKSDGKLTRVIGGYRHMACHNAKAAQTDATPRKRARGTLATPSAPQHASDPVAAECKRLRDELNLSWMAIGAKLSLPGSKSGAATARKLYAQANGGSRPAGTVKGTGATRQHKGSAPKHVGNTGSKTDRKIQLVERGHVIPTDMPDEEVEALVAGRTVEWGIDVRALAGGQGEEHWTNQEARVHPTDVYVEEDLDDLGGRVLRFREYLGIDTDPHSKRFGDPMGGSTRTIRVNAIHTVR